MSARTKEVCQREVGDVEEYAGRVFGVEVDHAALKLQIRQIIADRINDFIYQRFRDWPIQDLLKLEDAVDERLQAIAKLPESREGQPRRGRPPRSSKDATQQEASV